MIYRSNPTATATLCATNLKDREILHKDSRPTGAGHFSSSGSSLWLAVLLPCVAILAVPLFPCTLQGAEDTSEEHCKQPTPTPSLSMCENMAHWSAVCAERARVYEQFDEAENAELRTQLQESLEDLQNAYPSAIQEGQSWYDYLMWKDICRLAASEPLEEPLLDDLELSWSDAPWGWGAGELAAASASALRCIRVCRASHRQETSQQQAEAWNSLADLLESPEGLTRQQRSSLAEALWERERLGQSPEITSPLRKVLSKPNLVVNVSRPWFTSQLSVQVDEPFKTRGVFAGADTVATGRMTGATECHLRLSPSGLAWDVEFQGESNSMSTSCSRGVQIKARSETTVSGSKRFRLSPVGLETDPAEVSATTDMVYENISTGGLAFRQAAACSRAAARRPQAERDTSESVSDSVRSYLDEAGKDTSEAFNQNYRWFRNQFATAGRIVPQVQLGLDDQWIQWESRLEGLGGLAAPDCPPVFDTTAPVTLHVAASAVEELALALLGDGRFTQDDLAERINSLTGEDAGSWSTDEPFVVEFCTQPVRIAIEDDRLLVTFSMRSFESGDTTFPAMTVRVDYAIQVRDDGVTLTRAGKVTVEPLEFGADGADRKLTGRQQTLRLVAQRKLNRIFKEEIHGFSFELPLTRPEERVRISQARARHGWLQLAATQE